MKSRIAALGMFAVLAVPAPESPSRAPGLSEIVYDDGAAEEGLAAQTPRARAAARLTARIAAQLPGVPEAHSAYVVTDEEIEAFAKDEEPATGAGSSEISE